MTKATLSGLAALAIAIINKFLTLAHLPHLPPSVVEALTIVIMAEAAHLAEQAPAKLTGRWHWLIGALAVLGSIGIQFAPSPAAPSQPDNPAVVAPATVSPPVADAPAGVPPANAETKRQDDVQTLLDTVEVPIGGGEVQNETKAISGDVESNQ